ncbi:MAG: hypothetical protein V9E94_14410 [Microthrixaceae bacterium]
MAVKGTRTRRPLPPRARQDHLGLLRHEPQQGRPRPKALSEIPRAARAVLVATCGSSATANGWNQSLEKALPGRGLHGVRPSSRCRDALHREESCGGHFREEHQTEDGEAKRDDENFAYVAAWEYAGPDIQNDAVLNKEPLVFENVRADAAELQVRRGRQRREPRTRETRT